MFGSLRSLFLNSNQAFRRHVAVLIFAKPRGRHSIFCTGLYFFVCRMPKLRLSVITECADIAKQISKAVVWHVAVVAVVCKSWNLLQSGIVPNRKKPPLVFFPPALPCLSVTCSREDRNLFFFLLFKYFDTIKQTGRKPKVYNLRLQTGGKW